MAGKPVDYAEERKKLIEHVNNLDLDKSLKSYYQQQIISAFIDIESGGTKGVSQLKELQGRLSVSERVPVTEFLKRYKRIHTKKIHAPKKDRNTTSVDLAVICALKDPELNRVLDLLSNRSESKSLETAEMASHTYYFGEFHPKYSPDREAISLRVVAAHQSQIGIVDCAILATKMIQLWKPRYLVMTGVCGGRKSLGVRLGDIIVPKAIFTYQSGEFADEGFRVEPKVVNMDHGLTQRIDKCSEWIPFEIVKSWPGPKHDPPRVWTHPLACGDAVINRKDMIDNELARLHRKVVGVDMESFAVLRATKLLSEYGTKPLVIKAVMDFTEGKETCSDKEFAAFASAQFLYYFALAELG